MTVRRSGSAKRRNFAAGLVLLLLGCGQTMAGCSGGSVVAPTDTLATAMGMTDDHSGVLARTMQASVQAPVP